MHSAPEDVEQKQQDQNNQYLVPKRDGLRTVNAPGLPANLRKMQVVWRVHEFQGDEGAWFIGHLIQYLANSGPELPIGPFLNLLADCDKHRACRRSENGRAALVPETNLSISFGEVDVQSV